MPGKKILFDEALEITGFGKYNVGLLVTCCLLILAMYLDIFGFSVALPAVACDLGLSTVQQGLLSAVPLIGVMISSYCWGLCADTAGRRKTLLIAMPVGAFLNLAAGLAPTYASLAVLKFLSASFTSSANAAAYVLLGESAPQRYRSPFMFLMASTTMFAQLIICVIALPIFQLTFHVPVTWLSLEYRPWRLLLQTISLPGVIGSVGVMFCYESPKFLLSKGREDDAIRVLRKMYSCNNGKSKVNYKISTDCTDVIQPVTLYAVMCYSGASGVLTILLSLIVGPLGKRATTILVFAITALCGLLLLFVKIPLLSIALFYVFLYVALILGNVNTYLVELNPTHLRGMATSLSVVVARGLGFFSVQLIATLLGEHCTSMITGYVALVTSGLIVSYFLPSEVNKEKNTEGVS